MKTKITEREIYQSIEEETPYYYEDIEDICRKFTELLYQNFKNGREVSLKGMPDIKVKTSKANVHGESPRTPRNDRVIVTLKIPLESKRGGQRCDQREDQ